MDKYGLRYTTENLTLKKRPAVAAAGPVREQHNYSGSAATSQKITLPKLLQNAFSQVLKARKLSPETQTALLTLFGTAIVLLVVPAFYVVLIVWAILILR
ncbi:MAG: hypothetical protein ACOYYU_13215 [Chloroflexota bacterium]